MIENQKEEELKEFGGINKLKNDDELKTEVDEQMKKFVKTDGVKLLFNDKIFLQ